MHRAYSCPNGCGLSYFEAEVAGKVLGGMATAGIGAVKTKSFLGTLILGGIGALVGHLVDTRIEQLTHHPCPSCGVHLSPVGWA